MSIGLDGKSISLVSAVALRKAPLASTVALEQPRPFSKARLTFDIIADKRYLGMGKTEQEEELKRLAKLKHTALEEEEKHFRIERFLDERELERMVQKKLGVAGVFQGCQANGPHLSPHALKLEIPTSTGFLRERVASPASFDRRSFRTISEGDHRIIIGCPKGSWQNFQCQKATRPQAILHPMSEVVYLLAEAQRRGIPVIGTPHLAQATVHQHQDAVDMSWVSLKQAEDIQTLRVHGAPRGTVAHTDEGWFGRPDNAEGRWFDTEAEAKTYVENALGFAQQSPVDMAQLGPQAWQALHAWATDFKTRVGESCSCGDMAVHAMQGFHDAVSVSLGKPAMHPEDLRALAAFTGTQAESLRKEPWQMTLLDYSDALLDGRMQRLTGGRGRRLRTDEIHRELVRDALERGKPVPPEVLAEYPDLAARVAKPTTVKAQARKIIYCPRHGCQPVDTDEDTCPECADEAEDGMGKHPKAPAQLSQSFLNFLLYGAATAAGASLGASFISRLLTPKATSPEDTIEVVDSKGVYSPPKVEGDQAQVDLGTLLAEIDAILKKPDMLGLVDPTTQKVLRKAN